MFTGLTPWSQTALSSSSDLCTSNGIKFSAPYTPEENGKTELTWGTPGGMTPCMMATAWVSKKFCPFALSTAIYLKNLSIYSAHGKTPSRCFTEASLTFQIFTCLGASRLCSSKSGRSWSARYGKLFGDTQERPRHMWWPQQTSQSQGHQMSGCHET